MLNISLHVVKNIFIFVFYSLFYFRYILQNKCLFFILFFICAAAQQNQPNDMCAQRRLRSAWASAQSDQSFRCPHEESLATLQRTAKTLIRLGGCPGWSKSSLGAQSFCWFCHAAAHFIFIHRYTGGGTTTDAALRFARQNMFVRKHGMRKGVAAQIAIVITDGNYLWVLRHCMFCLFILAAISPRLRQRDRFNLLGIIWCEIRATDLICVIRGLWSVVVASGTDKGIFGDN